MAGRLDSTPDLTHKVRGMGTGVAYSYQCAIDGCRFRSSSLQGWGDIKGPFGRIRICPEHKQQREERASERAAAKEKAKATEARKTGNRLGAAGYASILRALQQQPMTMAELREIVVCGQENMRRILNRMLELRLVHRSAWLQQSANGASVPIWSYGAGVCAPSPTKRRGGKRIPMKGRNVMSELVQFAHVIRALAEPVSAYGIVEKTGASHGTVLDWMKFFRSIGFVRIAEWEQKVTGFGKPYALWQLGSAPDAKRPARMTRIEIERRYREAKRAKDAQIEITNALTRPNQEGAVNATAT